MAFTKQVEIQITAENIRKCTDHPDKNLIMTCATCSDQLVCTKCVVTGHKTHIFSELEDLVNKKRVPMAEFVESSGKQLGKLRSVLTSLQNLKQTVTDNSKTLEESVEKRVKVLQQQLNEIANNIKEEQRNEVGQNVTAIDTRIEFVTSLQQEITESLTKCQAALESQSLWDVIDFQLDCDTTEKMNSEFVEVPQVSNHHLIFNDEKLSGSVFGVLTAKNYSVKDNEESCPPPLHPGKVAKTEPTPLEIAQMHSDAKENRESVPSPLPPMEVVEIEPMPLETAQHFRLPFGSIDNICILNKNEAWISYTADRGHNFHPTIHHVTRKGDIISTVELDSPVTCLRLSSDKSLLASCTDNNMRCITPDGKISVLFDCHGYTTGFCEVGKIQDIVVCLCDEGQVVKYSRQGKVLQSLSSCIKEPVNISANKVTGEMVIIDNIEQRKLVVVDSKMNFLWEMDSWLGTSLKVTIEEFMPIQACYDNSGNILAVMVSEESGFVIKMKNKKVQKFKRIGCDSPYAIDVEDEMWIGMDTGDVIITSSDI